MSDIALTTKQIHMMRHALGLNDAKGQWARAWKKTGATYRNHYCASDIDAELWRPLVAAGLAGERAGNEMTDGAPSFHVTDAGKQWLKESEQ